MYYINNLCFLCLIYYKNKSSKGNNYLKVQDELQYLIPEKILNSSKTPKYVCSDCKENILNIKKFRDNYLKNILKYNELVQNLTAESDPQKCLSDNLNRELNPTFTKIKSEPCDNENLEILSDTEDFNSSKNEIKSTNVEQVLIKVEDTTDYYEENENSSPQDSNCVEQVEINNKNEELGQFLEINIQESSNKNYLPGNSATSQNDSNPAVNTCTQNEKLFQNAKTLEEKFKCNKCSKIYQSKKNLEKHSVIHLEHKCELCFKIFTQLNDLIKHVTTCNGKKLKACDVSDDAEKYPCELCGKSFKSASSLTLHKRVHTGERPYECDVCHKKFSSRTCLRVHKRLHTGEKPYVCDVCQKAFYIFRRLKVHYRTHTGEKPYGCDLCEKTFAQANLLKAHKRVHTGEKPYVCDVCQKAFTKWFTMKEHKRTHSDERPFTCDVCQKAFKTATGISQHKRIHKVTQEKKNE